MKLKGFTLIELLVVLSIIAIISSMIFASRPEMDSEFAVDLASRELAATLNEARSLATISGKTHWVTFHIENAGDGRVLWNFNDDDAPDFPGRHWYAIIGPTKDARHQRKSAITPPPPWEYLKQSQQHYTDAIIVSQIGQRHYLPRGTRFLAISDQDFGTYSDLNAGRFKDEDWCEEYPRPWFGVLQPKSVAHPALPVEPENNFILYPWGGYDMEWEAAQTPATVDRIYGSNRSHGNQKSRFPRTGFNRRGNLDPGEWTVPQTWAERPIIRGLMTDVYIVFTPDGRAYMDRKWVADTKVGQDTNTYPVDHHIPGHTEKSDRPVGLRYGASGTEHDDALTGGFNFTICRDIDMEEDIYPNRNRLDVFRNEADALKSILPFRRVFVKSGTGSVSIRDEGHRYCQVRMNQKNIHMADVGLAPPDGSNGLVFRPAHRHIGFSDRIDASLHDTDWTDDGWKGWFPPYESP